MMMRRFLFVTLLFSGWLLAATPSQAGDFAKEAETFVQTLADEAMNSFRTTDDEVVREKEVRRLLNEGFDVRAIGKWVLGRYWRKAKPAEKEEYLDLFEDFIIVTYAGRFKDYSGDEISLKVTKSLAKNDSDAIVRSEISRPQATDPILVDWRVKGKKDGTMKVVDVLIAGVSMSQTQRSEFSSVIKRNGGQVSGLIEALRSKTAELVNKVDQVTN